MSPIEPRDDDTQVKRIFYSTPLDSSNPLFELIEQYRLAAHRQHKHIANPFVDFGEVERRMMREAYDRRNP